MSRLIRERLMARAASGEEWRIAVAGCGFLGGSLVRRFARIPGLRLVAVADRHPERAAAALRESGLSSRTGGASGPVHVVADPIALNDVPADAVVDCTGDVELGARLGLSVIAAGRALFTNAEADATFGPALAHRARARGVLYSGCGGDEPAEAFRLVEHVRLLGLEVVAAGKFKAFLDPTATPASVAPWAARHGQNPHMATSFADGTKMALEMASLANATRLVPDVFGMHCPRASATTAANLLHDAAGGILGRSGVVEVVLGAEPTSAVFVVVRAHDAALSRELAYLKQGEGPTHLLTKPFHLCGIELAGAIATALSTGEATISPLGAPVAGVGAVAKRDLAPGAVLERLGNDAYFGRIGLTEHLAAEGLLPVGLAPGARLLRQVPAGQPIRRGDVELPADSVSARLHAEAFGAPC